MNTNFSNRSKSIWIGVMLLLSVAILSLTIRII